MEDEDMSDKKCDSSSQKTGSGNQQEYDKEKLTKSLSRIKHKIVILSGKGGVGKSSVATNIAVGLSLAGKKVGLLDVDVHGPSIPRLLSLSDARPEVHEDLMEPIQWSKNLSVISLGFMLPNKDDSVIWRGPIKMSLIRQFLGDVAWGDLDYLVVDCPPGTGDEPISVMQLLGHDAYAVIVTTPQVLSIDDVRRSINFCRHTENPILGVVENMSGFVCPHCNKEIEIFNAGGGEKLAQETGVRFLGRIPLDPEMVRSGDEGYVYVKAHHDHPTAQAINKIIKPILALTGDLDDDQSFVTAAESTDSEKQAPVGSNGASKIAIPVVDGKLCLHFGHSEKFAVVSVDEKNKKIENIEMLTPPPHEPGVLPKWLSEQNVELVIAGGIGSRAHSLFSQYGVRVIAGAQSGTPEEVVQAYLNGNLDVGSNMCDH